MSLKTNAFAHFGLEKSILSALSDLGYERATPIQEQSIPVLLNGEDLLAQAQTGTGKTAAFALPILSGLDHSVRAPQALILAPTRELAIQVAEAFQSYAKHIKGFSVTPIYGGQDFGTQLRSLKRGSQVIVGTPGRLMDHMRRKTISLDALKMVVLDEADEMLKMGFAEDVEWILSQMTGPHQTALFSATLPSSIQKIAQKYLKNAKKIQIKAQVNAVETIEQCYISVSRNQKLEALTRLLEVEENQGVIIFTRTKNDSAELAEKLQARGYTAAALNGDMSQGAREKTINRLKKGDLDILVATDVAARGIDVERVTHVINYDIPTDVDAYIHRIGRTGRAGRNGKAILFVAPREMRLLNDIERHINKSIKRIEPPSLKVIREKRAELLTEKMITVIREKEKQIAPYIEIVMDLTDKHSLSAKSVAAALMYLNEEESSSIDVSAEETSFEHKDRERFQRNSRDRGPRDRYSKDRTPRDQGNRGRPFENRSGDRFSDDDKKSKPRHKFGASRDVNRPEKSGERSDRPERKSFNKRDERFDRTERKPFNKTGERSNSSERNTRTDTADRKPYVDHKKSRSFNKDRGRDVDSSRPTHHPRRPSK